MRNYKSTGFNPSSQVVSDVKQGICEISWGQNVALDVTTGLERLPT